MGAFLFAPHHRQPTDRRTSRPETARRRFRRQLTGRSRRQSRGPERPSRPGQRPAKHTARPADQPPDPARSRDTTSNSKHKSTTVYQNERGAGTRQRAGHPPRFALAGRGTGRQGPRLWAACRPARGLPWPCRPGKRPALPPAGGVPPRPAARECAGRRRLRRQCARRSKLRPAAAARAERPAQAGRELAARRGGASDRGAAWRGPLAGQREHRGAATPGGECVGRAARHGLRRRRGRAGKAGRSAADRAGGADGPTAPTSWGPGRPGAPTPQPAGGWPGARPAKRPRRGLALRPDWVAPSNGWRLAWPEPPTGGDQPPHYPDCRRQAGRAAAPPPHRVGRVSGPQAAGAGGTRPGAPGHGREPLFPGRYTARENKRGSAHRALPLGFAD